MKILLKVNRLHLAICLFISLLCLALASCELYEKNHNKHLDSHVPVTLTYIDTE